MGLHVYIYKDAVIGPCSNGGVSERADRLTLVNVEGPFEPSVGAPAAMLVHGNLAGTVKIVPAENVDGDWFEALPAGRVGPMYGGCYVATSDSRFGEAVERLVGHRFYGAVALHDRWETVAEYEALSR